MHKDDFLPLIALKFDVGCLCSHLCCFLVWQLKYHQSKTSQNSNIWKCSEWPVNFFMRKELIWLLKLVEMQKAFEKNLQSANTVLSHYNQSPSLRAQTFVEWSCGTLLSNWQQGATTPHQKIFLIWWVGGIYRNSLFNCAITGFL